MIILEGPMACSLGEKPEVHKSREFEFRWHLVRLSWLKLGYNGDDWLSVSLEIICLFEHDLKLDLSFTRANHYYTRHVE
jgi:hypothetical protein